MKEIRRLVFRLVLLLVALFILYLLVVFVPAFRTPDSFNTLQASQPPDIRPSAESAAIARSPQSFQYLVSITHRGFEPSTLNIKKSEIVRFTNNSGAVVRLAGESAVFASADALASRDYRELMFDQRGAFHYSDTATGKDRHRHSLTASQIFRS